MSNGSVVHGGGASAAQSHGASGAQAHGASATVGGEQRLPMSVPRLLESKRSGQPLTMVTCYDFPSARMVEQAGIDIALVGDTAAMTVLGYDSTVPVTVEELLMLAKAVRRGLSSPLLVADLPFGSYEVSDEQALTTAQRFVKEAGADAIKLEGAGPIVQRAHAIASSGIPVVGHIGLTPQTAVALGGFKAQARTAERAARLVSDALSLEQAGCCAIVLEAVPAAVGALTTQRLQIPTIGIGAGAGTDGQVLVWHDLLGLYEWGSPRFVKRYAELGGEIVDALSRYASEVRERRFPSDGYVYSISPEELGELEGLL
ncbi:MAG: 3-methyl-2-oxobutanoate hydroxymethyltransferase [Solirubrobacteraceae bacterium]